MSVFNLPISIGTSCATCATNSNRILFSCGYHISNNPINLEEKIKKENRNRKINSVLYNTDYKEMTYEEWWEKNMASERSQNAE